MHRRASVTFEQFIRRSVRGERADEFARIDCFGLCVCRCVLNTIRIKFGRVNIVLIDVYQEKRKKRKGCDAMHFKVNTEYTLSTKL